jgi:hypothetical protein
MFRGMKKLVSTHRERLVSLVLLPAFFFGTMPHTACICADGHREEFCKAALCRAIGNGSTATTCCGCSCCKGRGAHEGRSCCQAKSCQPANGGAAPANGIAAKTGSCCQPFFEAPAPAVVSGNADLGSQLTFVAATALPTIFIGADEFQPTLARSSFSTPPPLDAVIVFLHLTI